MIFSKKRNFWNILKDVGECVTVRGSEWVQLILDKIDEMSHRSCQYI